ncbi:MAG: hypothetical protein OD811_03600 [Alphaproteobacteria bacterium]
MSSIEGGGRPLATPPSVPAGARKPPSSTNQGAATGAAAGTISGHHVRGLTPGAPRRITTARSAPSLLQHIVQSLKRSIAVRLSPSSPPHQHRLAATLNPLLPLRFSQQKFIHGLALASVGSGIKHPFEDGEQYEASLKDALSNCSHGELRRMERRLGSGQMMRVVSSLEARGFQNTRPGDCASQPSTRGEAAIQMATRIRQTQSAVRKELQARDENPVAPQSPMNLGTRAAKRAEALADKLLSASEQKCFSNGQINITQDSFSNRPQNNKLFQDMLNFNWQLPRAKLPDGSESLITASFAKDFLRINHAFFNASGKRVEILTPNEMKAINAGSDSILSNPKKVQILENALMRYTNGNREMAWRISNVMVQTSIMNTVNPMLTMDGNFGPPPQDLMATTSLTPETLDKFVFALIPGQSGEDPDHVARSREWSDGPACSMRDNGDGTFSARVAFTTRPTGIVANGTTIFPLDNERSRLHSEFEMLIPPSDAASITRGHNSWRLAWQSDAQREVADQKEREEEAEALASMRATEDISESGGS